MIIKILNKYNISIVFFFYILLNVICSRWVQEVFPYPLNILRILTVLIYLPFILIILIKLYMDIKCKALFKGANIFYYSFFTYYVLISVWRIINHDEVKESFYFFIVIIGAIAFLIQGVKFNFFSKDSLIDNIFVCTAIICSYRISFVFLVNKIFSYMPINAIIFACIFIISIPFLVNNIEIKSHARKIVCFLLLVLSITFVLLSGSRASFYLLVFLVLAITVFMIIKCKKNLIPFFSILLCSTVIVTILFAINFKDVRKNVVREVWFLNSVIKVEEPVSDNNENINTEINYDELIDQQNQQIDKSDNFRRELFIYGINEIKKNPLFGTGNVLYEQQMNETYIANQSSHNFIIESLVSFGIIGSLLLLGSILLILIHAIKVIDIKSKFFLILTIGVLLAFSCIQPLFYNPIVVYPFFTLITAFCITGGKSEN